MRVNETAVGFWCVQLDDTSTWVAQLSREDGRFTLDYLFRYVERQGVRERAIHGALSARDVDDAVDRMRKVYSAILDSTRNHRGWEFLRDNMPPERFALFVEGMPGMKGTLQ